MDPYKLSSLMERKRFFFVAHVMKPYYRGFHRFLFGDRFARKLAFWTNQSFMKCHSRVLFTLLSWFLVCIYLQDRWGLHVSFKKPCWASEVGSIKKCWFEKKATRQPFWFGEKKRFSYCFILLMEEILYQLIDSLSHYLQGFIHPRWCRISSISSMEMTWEIKF